MGSLVVMSSGLGPEGPNLLSDTAKDPSSACGARACKIRDSGSPVVKCQQFTMVVVSVKKKFPTFKRHIKIEEVDDGWCCHLL